MLFNIITKLSYAKKNVTLFSGSPEPLWVVTCATIHRKLMDPQQSTLLLALRLDVN